MLPQPPVPASTVAYTNTSGVTAQVTITGGTVTSVNVNGSQVATATNYTAAVPAGSSIAITYSAAPAWLWSPFTPAVPASLTPVANTTGQPVTVILAGGTVTHVAVNGSDRATSSPAAVMLPAGASITLTYSAAPAWTWMPYQDLAPGDSLGTAYAGSNTSPVSQLAGIPYAPHAEGGLPGLGSAVSN